MAAARLSQASFDGAIGAVEQLELLDLRDCNMLVEGGAALQWLHVTLPRLRQWRMPSDTPYWATREATSFTVRAGHAVAEKEFYLQPNNVGVLRLARGHVMQVARRGAPQRAARLTCVLRNSSGHAPIQFAHAAESVSVARRAPATRRC